MLVSPIPSAGILSPAIDAGIAWRVGGVALGSQERSQARIARTAPQAQV